MTSYVPVALGGSTRGISLAEQRAELKALERAEAEGALSDASRQRLRMLRGRERQRRIRGKARLRGAAYFSLKGLGELMLLHRASLNRALSDAESERMGVLLKREQNDPVPRAERIRVFREGLEFLETLEMAERGSAAEGCSKADPVDLTTDGAGHWTAPQGVAA